jgi:hypothetical protein
MKNFVLPVIGAASLLIANGAVTREALAADMSPVYKAAPQAREQKPEGVDGFIDLYAGWQWWQWNAEDWPPGKNDQGGFGAAARVNWWISAPFAIQLDAQTEWWAKTQVFGPTGGNAGPITAQTAVHIAWRDPNRYAFSLLLGQFVHDDVGGFAVDNWATYTLIGGEAQSYWGDLTLYGQGGVLLRNSCSMVCEGTLTDIWWVRGVGRYFFTAKDKLQGEFGYAEGTDTFHVPNTKGRITTWGAEYEHWIDKTPVSVWVGYRGWYFDNTNNTSYKTTANEVWGGVRLWFGAPADLKTVDRKGATWDTPKFLQTLTWSAAVADVF